MSANPGLSQAPLSPYMVTFDRLPELGRMGRPLMFYGPSVSTINATAAPILTPVNLMRAGMMTPPARDTACTDGL